MPHQNIIQLQIISKNSDYKIYKFKDILVDETRKVKKIKKADYLSKGKNPIVDQSKDFISGYTDCNDKIYKQYPYILFGDHTRVFKYINFESYLGADGAKIINVHEKYSEKIDIKYIYYFLKSVGIPDTGYNRHFKYVKSLLFPVPPMELQEKIVKVLDQAQALIDKRKEQIEALDQLIESIFYTMFGDPVRNEKGWEVKELEEVLLNNVSNIKKDFKDDISYIDIGSINNNNNSIETYNNFKIKNAPSRAKRILNHGDILFSTVRPNLKNIAIFDMYTENTAIGSTGFCIIRVNESLVNNKYIFNVVKNKRLTGYLVKIAEGASYPAVKDSDIKSIKISIPPLSLQNEFAQKVQIIEKQKELLEESLELLDENYKSIMDRAFKGQLFN